MWWKPWPLAFGQHTATIADAIDKAVEAFLRGESTNLDIEVPFAHGKSDLVSRALPAYFLGRCHSSHPDIIMSGYGDSLVQTFSKDCKEIIRSAMYQKIFPGVVLAHGSDAVGDWQLEGSTGRVTAAGLGGGLTGKRANLLVIDDYCKNRAEARSEVFRRRQWEAFGDAMTRRAPVSIAILCATSWHVDDCRGRLRETEGKDANFPQFTRLRFPAKQADGSYLFPERFDTAWYASQYAMLGETWSSALLDCNPVQDQGNRFRVDLVEEHDMSEFPTARYIRAWDLASTSKERDKDSPDYTVGSLAAVVKDALGIPHIWLKDVRMGQWEAPERDATIIKTAERDGQSVPVAVEAFAAYKDAAIGVQRLLRGKRVVTLSRLPGDKSAKLADLEPIFQTGNVHVPRGTIWLEEWKRQFQQFPSGKHDDACDSLAICYHECVKSTSGIIQLA